MKVLIFTFALLVATEARRFCKVDDDCTDLGDITCQYSRCDSWGICGCPRGYATRFMGSDRKFQCAMLKKIGESCSEDGSNGVCGPDNSYCDGSCKCNPGRIAAWDGEKCLLQYAISLYDGETCSTSLGMCSNLDGSADGDGCISGDTFPDALDYEMPICACGVGARLVIPNAFDQSPFVGRREPTCQPIGLGDQCMFDDDCTANTANSECDNDVCKCITGYSDDLDGICQDMSVYTLLSQGTICSAKNGGTPVPSTSKCGPNMICGDICVPDEYNDNPDYDHKCTCKTGYTGSSCDPVTEGATCSGDWQCQGVGYDALCLDGACVAGGAGITFSLFTMLFMVVAHYL